MARQVLPIVGAIVGAYFGSPQLGYAIGSIIGNAVDPEVIQGPKIGEAGVQTSQEGGPRAIVMGVGPVVGNVICRGNRKITKQTEGGKGGPVTETERVSWTFAIAIGEPIEAVTRIWEDEKLVYDIRPESTIQAESAAYAEHFRLYLGSDDQLPDPDLEVIKGAGDTPAYPGTAYIVFPNFDLTDRRESIPTFRFEVAGTAEVTPAVPIGWMVGGSDSAFSVQLYVTDDPTEYDEDPVEAGQFSQPGLISAGNHQVHVFSENSGVVSADAGATFRPLSGLSIRSITAAMWLGSTHVVLTNLSDVNTSSDGINYSHSDVGVSALAGGVVLGSAIVACGYWSWASTDAATWTQHGFIFSGSEASTCVAGSGALAVAGSQAGRLAHSSDGVTWTVIDGPFDDDEAIVSIAYDDVSGRWALFNAVGKAAYSATGTAWTDSGFTLSAAPATKGLAGHDGVFVQVSFSTFSSGSADVVAVSEDGGETYTEITHPISHPSAVAYIGPEGRPAQAQGSSVSLASILTMLHGRVKQPASQFDVTACTEMVDGVVYAGDYSVRDAINATNAGYFKDAAEYDAGSGWKIHYISRGAAVVKTLTEDDLVDEPEESTRESAIEYPKKLSMAFQNPKVGYAPAFATSMRSSPDVRVVGEVQVQVPVVISDVDEAAQMAAKMHKVSWAEAGGDVVFTVSDEHMDLVASDCIGLSLRGTVRRLRITKIEDNPGTRKLTCRVDRQSAYTSNVTGVPLPDPTPPPPSIVGLSVGVVLDIPALLDTDDVLGYYDGMTGVTEAWFGGAMQRQNSLGEFATVDLFNSGTVIGVLTAGVNDASEHYTDTTNALAIQLYMAAEIDSLTDAQFLSEGGALAVEKPDGGWEIMQYRDADQDDETTVTLTTLHRGRLNSGTSAHEAGNKVVFLTGVHRVAAVTAMLDTDMVHRAVSFGTSPETANEITTEYTGLSQTEWPVANLILERDGDDLTATAIPRHRFGTEDNPVRSVNWVGYHWAITDGGLHNVTSDTTDSSISLDVSGWSSPITVSVSQVNRYTGAGPEVSEDIA